MPNGAGLDVEKIEHEGRTVAIVVRSDSEVGDLRFFTPKECPLQLGVMVHDAGYEIKPHVHKPVEKVIKERGEMLRVDYGKVDVDLYAKNCDRLKTVRLGEGDIILLISGGHGLRFPEKARLTEVKQGPYMGSGKDKEILKWI